MTYTPNMKTMSDSGAAYMVGKRDIERALNTLISRQGAAYGIDGTQGSLPMSNQANSFESWKRGQLEFARRIASITAKHAARHKQKFCWKHHSISLLRRLALVVMVASILSIQYI